MLKEYIEATSLDLQQSSDAPQISTSLSYNQIFRFFSMSTHTLFVRFGLLICTAIVWAFAAMLTIAGAYNYTHVVTKLRCRTDWSYLISTAPWIRIPYPFQWGAPIFRASHVFGMMGATIVSSVESTATHFATTRLSGVTPPPTHVLSRSIGLQGLELLIRWPKFDSSLFGFS